MASSAVPPVPGEPDVCVPASLVGGAAEILALIGDMADHDRGGVLRARVEEFMDETGAEPRPAADWLIASVRRLAREAGEALAREGIAVDRELPCYWRAPRPRQQGGRPLWRRSPRPRRRTTPRPPTRSSAATWPTSG